MNSTKVVHKYTNSTKVVHTNNTKVVHTNSSKVVHEYTNSAKVVHPNSTKVLSVFYHRSGIIFVALVAKPRVATSMRSHIPLQMTWYHTMSSRYFLYCSLRGAYKKQYLRWDGIYYHRSGENCGKFTTWVYHNTTTYSPDT